MVITGQIKLSNLKRLTGDKRSLVGSCVRTIGGRSGTPAPILDTAETLPLDRHILQAAAVKLASGRYLQDVGSFLRRGLQTRL